MKTAMLEHFQEKWTPVFRPKMRQCKNARAVSVSGLYETALGSARQRLARLAVQGWLVGLVGIEASNRGENRLRMA
jgi:hypothetical protein